MNRASVSVNSHFSGLCVSVYLFSLFSSDSLISLPCFEWKNLTNRKPNRNFKNRANLIYFSLVQINIFSKSKTENTEPNFVTRPDPSRPNAQLYFEVSFHSQRLIA